MNCPDLKSDLVCAKMENDEYFSFFNLAVYMSWLSMLNF